MSRFELSDKITREVTTGTRAVYKSHLNKLAKEGIMNARDILANQERVIEIVKNLFTDKSRRRVFYSAVFYAISMYPNETMKKELFEAFQEEKDEKTIEYKKQRDEKKKADAEAAAEPKEDPLLFTTADVDFLYFNKAERGTKVVLQNTDAVLPIPTELEKAKAFFSTILPKALFTKYFGLAEEAHSKYTIRYPDARESVLEDATDRKDKTAITQAKKNIKDTKAFEEKYTKITNQVNVLLSEFKDRMKSTRIVTDTKYDVI
jgi:hypothetical protein